MAEAASRSYASVFCIERKPVLGVEALTKGVDRACSDIAEDDTERGEAQRGKPGG